jgi:hypothetical protein
MTTVVNLMLACNQDAKSKFATVHHGHYISYGQLGLSWRSPTNHSKLSLRPVRALLASSLFITVSIQLQVLGGRVDKKLFLLPR